MFITKTSFLAVASVLALTNAAPLQRRIAQVISDSTQEWVKACTAAGGAEKCGTTSQTAFMTLLAAPGDCEQQNAADSMIDLAKTLNNDPKMIALAQVFAQQPRNSPDKLSVNYCQQEPKNAELKGLFQCQFQGVDPKTFTKNVKVGAVGTIPLGMNAPLDPPGSCKANPQGGIADGSQLVALTQDPDVGNSGNTGSSNSSGTSNAGSSSDDGTGSGDSVSGSSSSNSTTGDSGSATTDGSDSGDCSDSMGGSADGSASDSGASNGTAASGSGAGTGNASDGAAAPSDSGAGSANSTDSDVGAAGGADGAASGDFQLKNGQDAQAQNAKFATLTDSSTCNEGDQACINNGFAQCVGGKFQTTQCAAGTQCFALPKVLAPGTSLACTTETDATSRIKATGATGGITGA